MRNLIALLFAAYCLAGCASTTSYTPSAGDQRVGPKIVVKPFSGFAGGQASDMVAQELEKQGFDVIDSSGAANYILTGTCSAMGGPLYSFPHVNLTARVVDARSGKILWFGTYGNEMWTSAISTQGDMQRGAHDLVAEFKKTLGSSWGSH